MYDTLCEIIKKDLQISPDEFSIEISDNIQHGGYVADIFFLVITNKLSQEKSYIIVKQQKCLNNKPLEFTNALFDNETHFFKNIWTKLSQFYEERTGKCLDFVPECLSVPDGGIKKIVLENLTVQGFVIHDKAKPFDEEHLGTIFKTLGRFHGVSRAFKHYNNKEYQQFFKPIYHKYKEDFTKDDSVTQRAFHTLCCHIQKYFDPETEASVLEKLKFYQTEGSKLVYESSEEEKDIEVMLHGDCWSNNFMLKYSVSKTL